MPDTISAFARQVIALREAAGLSQYELARRAGLTKQAMSLLEKGQRGANWETVQRLAKALGVTCEAFADPDLELPAVEPPGKAGRPPKAPAASKGEQAPASFEVGKKRGRPRKKE